MKVRKTPLDHTRGIILDTLLYEVYLAPQPADPEWAARALEALDDAGLLDRQELDERELWFCRLKGRLAARLDVDLGE